MRVTRHVLSVVCEPRPHATRLKHWKGPRRLSTHIRRCGGLSFPEGKASRRDALAAALRIAEHPCVRTVRLMHETVEELLMVGPHGATLPILRDQPGVLGEAMAASEGRLRAGTGRMREHRIDALCYTRRTLGRTQ